MRALQLVKEKDLQLLEVPDPAPPMPGEVQVRIGAVALNHIDVWGWRGMAFAKRKLPLTVGAEAAGTVVALGEGVDRLHLGQKVTIYGGETCGACKACQKGIDNLCEDIGGIHGFHLDGFLCDLINLKARHLVPVPESVSMVDAACVPITFGTVEHMLFDNAKLERGESILVHAGGSGIGTAAIMLAKALDCTVITTVGSDEKGEKAAALGADHIINYREDRFEGRVRRLTKKKGVDVVFEHVGVDTWAGSLLCLKRGGRLVTCGSTSGMTTQMNLMQLFQQQYRIFGSFGCRMQNMADALAKMEQGIAHAIIDTKADLNSIDAALERMESRQVFGKIVVEL